MNTKNDIDIPPELRVNCPHDRPSKIIFDVEPFYVILAVSPMTAELKSSALYQKNKFPCAFD
jgi:hypothetical protein